MQPTTQQTFTMFVNPILATSGWDLFAIKSAGVNGLVNGIHGFGSLVRFSIRGLLGFF